MPKYLKNTEGLSPGALRIVKTPTYELRHMLESSQPSDIVAKKEDEKMNDFFEKKDYAGFAKFLPNATMAEKDTVVKLALDKGITDGGFTALIKKYCDVDVIYALGIKHQAEEK